MPQRAATVVVGGIGGLAWPSPRIAARCAAARPGRPAATDADDAAAMTPVLGRTSPGDPVTTTKSESP
ncbi:hypothetical protein [Streptomyces sp. NPDC002962]|uniref:hypothetical protein n=1 Tax=Streptomyces sp. NPDC002962 TaxID=3364674 RepID=UPI0036BE880A